MENSFKIRTYGFSELAQMYMPQVAPKSASVQLKRWLIQHKRLQEDLREAGYISGQKLLTPNQTSLIVKYIGIP